METTVNVVPYGELRMIELTDVSGGRLITGFRQGAAGNCASIAAIKASIMACAPEAVLIGVRRDGERFTYRMRDLPGLDFTIRLDVVESTGDASRFEGDDEDLLAHAKFLFCAMVLRDRWNRDEEDLPERTLDETIADLNDGEYFLDSPGLLGLGKKWVWHGPGRLPRQRRRFLAHHSAAIAANGKHAWFVSNGQHDDYGDVDRRKPASSTIALVRPTGR